MAFSINIYFNNIINTERGQPKAIVKKINTWNII